MSDVSIIYCRPCGYEKRAKEAAVELKNKLGIEAMLVPGAGGVFEVKVGEQTVAKRSKGFFPDVAEIVTAVAAVRM
ncbi:MAG: SelT/SelW/SelH family protein [Rhodospirillales bacterium]|nr:MAG: SelT/SelW/SelH family protein [Rhodospirillales bacterium]